MHKDFSSFHPAKYSLYFQIVLYPSIFTWTDPCVVNTVCWLSSTSNLKVFMIRNFIDVNGTVFVDFFFIGKTVPKIPSQFFRRRKTQLSLRGTIQSKKLISGCYGFSSVVIIKSRSLERSRRSRKHTKKTKMETKQHLRTCRWDDCFGEQSSVISVEWRPCLYVQIKLIWDFPRNVSREKLDSSN